jgi:hypothetical protein
MVNIRKSEFSDCILEIIWHTIPMFELPLAKLFLLGSLRLEVAARRKALSALFWAESDGEAAWLSLASPSANCAKRSGLMPCVATVKPCSCPPLSRSESTLWNAVRLCNASVTVAL